MAGFLKTRLVGQIRDQDRPGTRNTILTTSHPFNPPQEAQPGGRSALRIDAPLEAHQQPAPELRRRE